MSLPGFGLIALLLPWMSIAETIAEQIPLISNLGPIDSTNGYQERIAIIGAGIGSASAAFNIYQRNRNRQPQEVTVFEREANVGGRISSTYLYPLTDDWCLNAAMQEVGLKHRMLPLSPISPWTDGGTRTEVKCNAESGAWQDFLHGIWTYGRSWRIFHAAVQSVLEKWHLFGSPYKHPFNSIKEELHEVGLTKNVTSSATKFLRKLADLSAVSGLSAVIAAGKSTTTSAHLGNSRLVERLISISGADLQLRSIVTAITPGFSRRYRLSISQIAPNESCKAQDLEFDVVILATPLESSDIDLGGLSLRTNVVPAKWIQTHVTHFSSPHTASSNLSILPLDMSIVNEETLTMSATMDNPNIVRLQRSAACFRRGCSPGDECDECDDDSILYRVHSHKYMEDEDIVGIVGQDRKEETDLSDYGIKFVRRRAWPYSYPQRDEANLDTVDEIEIAPDLFYLNGAESLISSMEMGCRMGRNVAYKATRYGRDFIL